MGGNSFINICLNIINIYNYIIVNRPNYIYKGNYFQEVIKIILNEKDLLRPLKNKMSFNDEIKLIKSEIKANTNERKSDIKIIDIILCNMAFIHESLSIGKSISWICKMLGISTTSFYTFKKQSIRFNNFIVEAQNECIDNVKMSLYSKAQDKYVTAEKVLADGKKVKYNKYVPSDINAIKTVLYNKAPEEFQDKQEIKITTTNINVDIVDDLKIEEIESKVIEYDSE